MINIKIDPKDFKLNANAVKQFGQQFPAFAEKELKDVLLRVRGEAEKGRDPNGAALTPGYSESYKKAISAGLVRGKDPGNLSVTLRATGAMQGSMQTEKLGNGAQIFFSGQHPASKPLKARRTVNKKTGAIKRIPRKLKASKTTKTRKSGSSISNAELATVHENRGRVFAGYGTRDIDRIEKSIDRELDKILKALVTT